MNYKLHPKLHETLKFKSDILSTEMQIETPRHIILNTVLEKIAFRNYSQSIHRSGHLELLALERNQNFEISGRNRVVARAFSLSPDNLTWNAPDSFLTCLRRTFRATALKENTVSFNLQYRNETETKYFVGEIAHSGKILDTATKLFEKQLIMLLIFSFLNRDFSELIPENLVLRDCLSFGEFIQALGVRTFSKMKSLFKSIFDTKVNWQVGIIHKSEINEHAGKYFEIVNHPKTFNADPFLFEEDGKCFLFLEKYSDSIQKGIIEAFIISEGTIAEIGSVLEEKTHLSYPFVLKANGEMLMCPETSDMGQIRMYRASRFTDKWEFKETIFQNVSAVDSTIFFHGDKWWLLTNIDSGGLSDFSSELWLFHSATLESPTWVNHKKNPVYVNANFSRNGGLNLSTSPISRMAQRPGFGVYGQGISQRQIIILNENEFREKEIDNVTIPFEENYKASHHISTSQNFVAFDFIPRDNL
jgi:hypothetical protein